MTCFQPEDLPWLAVPALPAPKRFGADRTTGFAPFPPGGRLGWGPAAQKTATLPGSAASQHTTTAPALP